MPRCFAACETDFPAPTRSWRAEIVAGGNRGLPGMRPCFLALANPSLVRSEIRRRSKRAMALNLVIAAIMFWNTVYMDKAASHLAKTSPLYDAALLTHTSPLGCEHIILSGDLDWHSGAAERKIARPLNIKLARDWGT